MSDRYHSYGTGSSRSSRHDYRVHKERQSKDERYAREKRRSRSRSRSPTRNYSQPRSSQSETSRSTGYEGRGISTQNDWEDSDEEVPAPPPPPRITKISIDFSKPKAPIKMNLGNSTKGTKGPSAAAKPTVASVFNDDDDDDEPEEMPAEARMRMRNIGRETPTSAGPNSFGKTKQGFCDAKKVFEKNLKQALETVEKPSISKLPQTIYKIKGP